MSNLFISIIIPCRKISSCLKKETIPAILNQTYQNFEIIIIADEKSNQKFTKTKIFVKNTNPAQKRNFGIKKSRGEIIAFIDDDAYPDKDWLKNALSVFKNPDIHNCSSIVAVCGPGLTPPHDSFLAQISGWMWASPFGSGGAGQYRCWPQSPRLVDDYPTFNLLVKKPALEKIKGFNSQFWPGEDTKLCLDLVSQLKGKIVYHPKIKVFHHRRNVLAPHLKQIGRYGFHRGLFAKIFPVTSKKLRYFAPALFFIGFVSGPIAYLFFKLIGFTLFSEIIKMTYRLSLTIYFILLFLNSIWILIKSKNILLALAVFPVIFISHLFYGVSFTYSYLFENLR